MQRYYLTYDMSPLDERSEDYINLNIGMQNTEGLEDITHNCDKYNEVKSGMGHEEGFYIMLDNIILYFGIAVGIIMLIIGCLVFGSRKA